MEPDPEKHEQDDGLLRVGLTARHDLCERGMDAFIWNEMIPNPMEMNWVNAWTETVLGHIMSETDPGANDGRHWSNGMRIYVTGFTPATLAVANIFSKHIKNLIFMHWDRDKGDYIEQHWRNE